MSVFRPWIVLVSMGAFLVAQPARSDDPVKPPVKRSVTSGDVSKFPAPGTVVPSAFVFSRDGKSLSYLHSETDNSSRVLWKVDVSGGAPRVIARPPGSGDTDANVSQAEALRRERMRQRDTGITSVVQASKAEISVIPLMGDLYLLRGETPLERLTETASPEIDPRLNADGTKVAFVRDDDLFVLEIASKKETRLTSGAKPGQSHGLAEFVAQEEMDRFAGFWWSPDGAFIAYQETDEREIPLYSIAHEGSATWSIETHRYPFAGAANAKVRLGVIPSRGGETRWLELADKNEDIYLARVNWENPSSMLVQVLARDQKSLRLERFDIKTGTRTRVLEEKSDTWVNLNDDLRVLEKTGDFVWSSERTGMRHLELRDREGKLVRTLTSGVWQVDDVLSLDEKRREVWFSAWQDKPTETQIYRVSLDGGPVVNVSREPGMHKGVVEKSGDFYVDVFSHLGQPPTTTLRTRDGALKSTIADASSDSRVAESRLVPPVLTEYKNRDGVTLHGAYYAPRSKQLGDKAPLIVMVYGGPHVQTVTNSWALTADMTAQYLAEQGFAVWKTDNRGSSRRGVAFETALNRNMGTVEVRDQEDGVKFVAVSWAEVDTTRVGVTGGSYGGYMTLRSMLLAPDIFKAGVSVAPVTDWDGYDTSYTERYMGTPANNPSGYHEASVLPKAETFRGELLLIHGMLDENVHFRHSARLANALILSGKEFQFLPMPDSRHGARKVDDRKYIADRTSAFFQKHLGGTAH